MKQTKTLFEKPLVSLILIFFIGGILSAQLPIKSPYYRHHYYLSKALTRSKLDITDELKATFNTEAEMQRFFDYALFNGRHFIYLGVFPAILGIPFLVFGPQGYMVALLLFFLFFTIVILERIVKHFLHQESLLIALLLFISSPLLTTIVWHGPWYLAGLATVCLGLFFLFFYTIKRKNWAIFLIIPLFLTRPTTVFYFLIPLIESFTLLRKRKQRMVISVVALTIAFITFGSYNYLRFDHPLEAGYKYAVVPFEEVRNIRALYGLKLKDYFFNNVIYMFINPPLPHLDKAIRFIFPYFELSRFGVGLIYVIPWFFSYLFGNSKKLRDWPYLVTAVAILVAILSFGGEGSFQIGPRYACDFLPLLIFVNLKWLSKNKRSITTFKKLLVLSFFLNLYFLLLVQLGHMRRI